MEWADVDESAAAHWMSQCGAEVLIHGHTHHPQTEPFGPGMRHVLSDWDLDHTQPHRAEVLRWTAQGFERIPMV